MTTVNTFCTVTLAIASLMTAIHYAVVWGMGMTRQAETPVAKTAPAPAEIEKFDAAAGAQWVAEARSVAIMIAAERADGCCTADDVWFECAPPAGVDGRLLATVFDRREWEIVDRRQSARGRNAARQIAVWRRKSDVKVAA